MQTSVCSAVRNKVECLVILLKKTKYILLLIEKVSISELLKLLSDYNSKSHVEVAYYGFRQTWIFRIMTHEVRLKQCIMVVDRHVIVEEKLKLRLPFT